MRRCWEIVALAAVLASCRTEDRSEEVVGAERGRPEPAVSPPPAATPGAAPQGAESPIARLLGAVQVVVQGEIDASRLALEKAASDPVKSYAARMIADHQQDMALLTSHVQRRDIDVNGALARDPELRAHQEAHRQQMDALRALSGEAFDVAYLRDQPSHHVFLGALAAQGPAASDDPDLGVIFTRLQSEARDHQAAALRALPVACGGTLSTPSQGGGAQPQGGAQR